MENKWYKLDNAALIYAPSANSKWSCVFRLSCVLKEKVDKEILQQAVNDILPRFPTFMVRMRAGFFWYYFDENKRPFKITEETNFPCQFLNIRNSKHLFRVLYFNNRIAFEAFHAVTDGGGGLVFLKTLVRRYLEIKGVEISGYDGCLNYLDKPSLEETEDAYQQVADKQIFAPRVDPIAYKVDYPNAPHGHYYLTHGEMDTEHLKEIAKAKGASIGHLLAAAIAYAIYKHKQRNVYLKRKNTKKNHPVVVCASIDLRRKFKGHNSLRNFSYFINMSISDKEHTFDSILQEITAHFNRIDDNFLMANINSNVRDQNRKIVKILPLFLKNIGFNIAHKLYGETLNSVSMSNYGPTAVPQAFYDHVVRFESSIGVAKVGRNLDTSIITFGAKTVLTFCSMGTETFVERECFKLLGELGLSVIVDGNRRVFNE